MPVKFSLCQSMILLLASQFFINVSTNCAFSYLYVPRNFPSVQAAINAASPGDTLIIGPGIYSESIVIDKPLTLIGYNATLKGPGKACTVRINANNVKLIGLKITSDKPVGFAGVLFTYSTQCLAYNLSISNHYYGIKIYDSTKITLRNCTLSNNKFNFEIWGLTFSHFLHDIDSSNKVNGKSIYYIINSSSCYIRGKEIGYIGIVNSSGVVVENVSVTSNGVGVLMVYSSNCTLRNSLVRENLRGTRVLASHDVRLINNNFSYNEWAGVVIDCSARVHLERNNIKRSSIGLTISSSEIIHKISHNNTIKDNKIVQNSYGLQLSFTKNNLIEGNVVNSNKVGFFFEYSDKNCILRNKLDNNSLAIQLYNSNENVFYFNSFLKNSRQVETYMFSSNYWDIGYPLGGNYWSGFEAEDQKNGVDQSAQGSDGISDTPYVINKLNIDHYPQMSLSHNLFIEVSGKLFKIDLFSNSRIIDLNYDYGNRQVSIMINCFEEKGFLRILMPEEVLNCNETEDWNVKIDNVVAQALIFKVEGFTVLYVAFTHGKHFIDLFGDSMFKSKVFGDVNLDGKVNIFDVLLVGRAFGSYVGHPRWNPFADMDMNGKIDIADIFFVLKYFYRKRG